MRSAVRRYWVEIALIAVAAVWGGTFVMVKDAVSHYPLYGFLAWRFGIAVVAFALLMPGAFRRFGPGTIRVGLLAGAFLTLGYVFQTWGLEATTASKAAFITGMFVVITPVLQALVLGRLPGAASVGTVVAAVAGLWLLTGGGPGGWNAGDTRVLLCAVAYSAHMIVLGSLGRRHDAGALTLVQLTTVAVACTTVTVATGRAGLPAGASVWLALLVTGVLASAVAFWVQTTAQRTISPTRTALILVSEPAFGGLFGWWWAGEALGVSGLAGAALILGGMTASELVSVARPRAGERIVHEPGLEGPPATVIESAGDDRGPDTTGERGSG